MFVSTAPAGPPTSVRADSTSSTITVQWGPVECPDRNGDITGYSVQYGETESGSLQTISVTGGDTTSEEITGLTTSTNYTYQVAAVNSAGTGVYSDPQTITTDSE